MEKTDKSKNENKGERIAKRMARAGLCSRREAERWIENGRVEVNGDVLTSAACVVTNDDKILVDGKSLASGEKTRLFLYHKPAGLLTTNKDNQGRDTIFDKLPQELPRVVTVGRLDMNTEGLLLLTNDGELSRYLELPQNGVERTYRVRAHGHASQNKLDQLKKGVRYKNIRYSGIKATLEKQQGDNAWITMSLKEGKNREVRNIVEYLGMEVNRLIRTSYGSFHLGNLPKGSVMEIKYGDIKKHIPEFFK